MKKKDKNLKPTINNRRASFEYHFEESFEAGIVLTGVEVKSIRESRVQMQDSFCYFIKNELFISNLEITNTSITSVKTIDTKRLRKLLLHKSELKRLKDKLGKGYTIIPSKIFFNDRNIAKVIINLAKGKTQYDKREALKERDAQISIKYEK
jgi:SsrA-binding protein